MRHDLHIHTTASDGVFSPEQIVDAAIAGGLHVIAISDHDTTNAVMAARTAAQGRGLTVIAAAEVSSTHQGREVHVLGYGLDLGSPAVTGLDTRAQDRRMERMGEMVEKLGHQDIAVGMEDVLEAAGPDHHMIGRPHLAAALVELGHASSVANAFDLYIANHHPAFVPTELGSPHQAVELILAAGGLPVWAHPPMDMLDELLPGMVEAGLSGIEVYRPGNSGRTTRKLQAVAEEYDLFVTGGSDWHNLDRNDPLGAFWVTSGQLKEFRARMQLTD